MINCLLLCIVLSTIKPQADAKNVYSFEETGVLCVAEISEKGNLTAAVCTKGKKCKSGNLEIVQQVLLKN